jgi:hypothetical protein
MGKNQSDHRLLIQKRHLNFAVVSGTGNIRQRKGTAKLKNKQTSIARLMPYYRHPPRPPFFSWYTTFTNF